MPPKFDPRINPYKILGVSPTASISDIKKAFKDLAVENHPDTSKNKGGANVGVRFAEICAARDALLDKETRRMYDGLLREGWEAGATKGGLGGNTNWHEKVSLFCCAHLCISNEPSASTSALPQPPSFPPRSIKIAPVPPQYQCVLLSTSSARDFYFSSSPSHSSPYPVPPLLINLTFLTRQS